MLDLLKKGYLMGLGAVTLTREKAEQIVDDLIKKGEVARENRPQFIQDLMKKAEEHEKELTAKIEKEVNKAISRLNIATKEDIERLEKKIEQLKKAKS